RPVLLVHGEASTLLSHETVGRMRARRPDMDLVSLPGIGHAPILNEAPVVAAIIDFLRRAG
ncbi:MAG: alpha/beta fold hydrolase, partial [Acetobacteraceae bacterium]